MWVKLILLVCILAVVSATDEFLKQKLAEKVFPGAQLKASVEVVDSSSSGSDKMGFGNVAVQAVGYNSNCKQGSAYLWQAYSGGACYQVGDGTGPIGSQRIGCTPPNPDNASSPTEWSMNMLQFASADCSGTAVQAVAQFHSTQDCLSVDNDSGVYSTFYRMTCVVPDADSSKPNPFHGFASAFYRPKDSACDKSPLVVQGLLSGACIKGTTTGADGEKKASNTSEFQCSAVQHSCIW